MFLGLEAVLLVVFLLCVIAEREFGVIIDFGSGVSEITAVIVFMAIWLFLLIGSPFFFRSLRWIAWIGWLLAVGLFVWGLFAPVS